MRRTLTIAISVVLLGAAALGYGWWYMAVGRWPLAGDLRHDFGIIEIAGDSGGHATHVFRLTNRTDEPIEIEHLRPGCGCTDVEASTRRVEPDASVEIGVTLNLARAGKKKADIALLLDGGRTQMLWIEGIGRRGLGLIANQPSVRLVAGDDPTPVIVFADVPGDDEPPPLDLDAPAGVAAEFAGWELVTAADARSHRPSVWRGRVRLSRTGETLAPPPRMLRVELGKATPLVLPVYDTEDGGDTGERRLEPVGG